jgi:hypothetical protein
MKKKKEGLISGYIPIEYKPLTIDDMPVLIGQPKKPYDMDNTIEIFGNVIKRDEIIGISVLQSKRPTDQMAQIFGAVKLTFKIFTKQNMIEIESDYFRLQEHGHEEEEKKKLREWESKYWASKEIIKELL